MLVVVKNMYCCVITGRMKSCSTLKRRLVNRSVCQFLPCCSCYRPIPVVQRCERCLYEIIPSTRNNSLCSCFVTSVDHHRSFFDPLCIFVRYCSVAVNRPDPFGVQANMCLVFCSLANVNSRSRSLYAIARPSYVTFVRPTQAVQIFGNISMALGTLGIH